MDDEKGAPIWQDHLKADRQTRSLILSDLATEALRPHVRDPDSDLPVFPSRNGGWLRPGNVRRILNSFRTEYKQQLADSGINPDLFTPHLFRRTVATAIAHGVGVDRAKEQLGHASVSTTERHYVTPASVVGSEAASIIDSLFGTSSEPTTDLAAPEGES